MAIKNISSSEFKEMLDANPEELEVIDVREPEEHSFIKIRGSKLIPMATIPLKIDDINWNKEVVLVCRSGARSFGVAKLLSNTGKDVCNLVGGIHELKLNNCPCLEKSH